MSTSTDPDLRADDLDLARLLTDRAATFEPRGTTSSHLARRATRIRNRRRAAVAGVGLSAGAVVAAVVVTRPAPEPQDHVVADGGGTTTVATEPVPAPAMSFTPFMPELSTGPSGPPLRLGLDIPGAVVNEANDYPGLTDPAHLPDPAIDVTLTNVGGDRSVSISAVFGAVQVAEDYDGPMPTIPTETVDLGNGTVGNLRRSPGDARFPSMPPSVSIMVRDEDSYLSLYAVGVADQELIELTKTITMTDDPELRIGWVPSDLAASAVTNPMGGGGRSSGVIYQLADGRSVSLTTRYSPEPTTIDADLARIRGAQTDIEFIRLVRGNEAIVRKAPGTTPIVWREPSGYVVEMYVTVVGDPTAIADEGIVDSVVELDEATFQALDPKTLP